MDITVNNIPPPCKLCGSSVDYRFSLPLVDGLVGRYFECRQCHLLQSWHLDSFSSQALDDFYGKSQTLEEDSGAAWRQYCIATRLTQLRRLGAFPSGKSLRFLDYGGGSGFTTSFVIHRFGWTAYTFDAHSAPAFSPQRLLRTWSEVVRNGPYDVVLATEVIEHLIRPREALLALNGILANDAHVYLTTGLYVPGACDANWNYLAPASGQHVCLYSMGAIQEVARLLGASFAMQVGSDHEWLLARCPTSRFAGSSIALGMIARVLRSAVSLGLSPRIA
jgi:hypothetical protein